MAERKPLFLSDEGYSEEMNTADSMTLGALTMGGEIAMGNNKITGLLAGADGTDAINKNQLDALSSGISWKEPVQVLNMIDDSDQGGTPPGTPVEGDAYVVNNWGGGYVDGDIIEYDGAAWNIVVTNVGSEPPDGTRVLVSAISATTPAGSFAGSDLKIGTYDATGNTWSFDAPVDGWAILVIGDASIYADLGYTYDGTDWVQFTGAGQIVAGEGLSKSGNTLDVNAGDGIKIDTDRVAIDLDASSPGLELTGSTPDATLGVKDGSGIEVTSNGVEVDLAASNPGLEFSTGELQVKAGDGITRSANGVDVELSSSDPGLELVGSSPDKTLQAKADGAHGIIRGTSGLEIEIDDTPDTLDVDADGLKVVGLPLQFKLNGLAVKNTVTKAALDALSDGSNADAYHTHTGLAVDEAERVENIVAVDAAVSLGDPVYFTSTGDRVSPSDSGSLATTRPVGVATTAQPTPGSNTTVVSIGVAAGVFVGATPGTRYYLAVGGGLTTTRPTGTGNRIIQMGFAKNTTDLWVEIQDYGRAA